MYQQHSQNIEELCAKQIEYVRAGFLPSERSIKEDIYKEVCKQTQKLDVSNNITDLVRQILIREEAYELVESRQLDFPSHTYVTLNSRNHASIHLKLPKLLCQHYSESLLHVFGPNHKAETYINIGETIPAKDIDLREFNSTVPYKTVYSNDDNLNEALVEVKVTPNNSFVQVSQKCLTEMEQNGNSIEQQGTQQHGNWVKIIRDMLTPSGTQNNQVKSFGAPSAPKLMFKGDVYRNDGIARIIALKTRSLLMRPFIVNFSVWSDETSWLACLVKNIGVNDRVQIICPDKRTELKVKYALPGEFRNVSVHGHRGEHYSLYADYLIFYKAQMLGLAEVLLTINSPWQPDDVKVILVGSVRMPNLRVRCQQVRDTCGSVLDWFYNRDRYPEYFEEDSPYILHIPLSVWYHPKIFNLYNKMFYDDKLVNLNDDRSLELNVVGTACTLLFEPVKGSIQVVRCSPYNIFEAEICVGRIKELVYAGVDERRIGVLTTYCGQKAHIEDLDRRRNANSRVFVGILNDFVDNVYDYLIISTVETAKRVADGRRYPFDDLLNDRRCFIMALTRGVRHITLIGDPDMLNGKDLWKQLLHECDWVDHKNSKESDMAE